MGQLAPLFGVSPAAVCRLIQRLRPLLALEPTSRPVDTADRLWIVDRGPGAGTVSLGPAELHGEITRDDVAATLAELIHEPRIGQQILELNKGSTPIQEAVRASVRS